MTTRPETKYARSGDVHIAYQVFGDGPIDLVFLSSWISQIEQIWEHPAGARFLSRLAGFSRVILLDKRGAGLSDRVSGTPSVDERTDDVRAVMDAVDSKRAALFGTSEGGILAAVFAATYPERSIALVMSGSGARFSPTDGYPWGFDAEMEPLVEAYIENSWGSGEGASMMAPDLADDPVFRAWYAQLERLSGSPGSMRAMWRWNMEMDIREILPVIRVPTLVLHRAKDRLVQVECGRYVAEQIPGARYVELPGSEHYAFIGDVDRIVDEVEEFLTGMRTGAEPDRVLATVLFTDLVGSTERATQLGDRQWRDVLAEHQAAVRRELELHRGREVKTTGDGFLATFDGPARAIRCACAIRDQGAQLGVEIRAGLHTGEVEVIDEDIGGIAVHIGARVSSKAQPGEVLVSSTVRDLVAGSGIRFESRGLQELKGVAEPRELLSVSG
jgi:class 3 adenylate cyclase/pimeloyl-ACP methyl ester carboxylesterase